MEYIDLIFSACEEDVSFLWRMEDSVDDHGIPAPIHHSAGPGRMMSMNWLKIIRMANARA